MAVTRKAGKHAGSRKAESSKTMKHNGGKVWCLLCKKFVEMKDGKEVSMKRKGGKMGRRLAGVDAEGHKVSKILPSK